MKTNSWCQINDFLFIWKGNWEQKKKRFWMRRRSGEEEERNIKSVYEIKFKVPNKTKLFMRIIFLVFINTKISKRV